MQSIHASTPFKSLKLSLLLIKNNNNKKHLFPPKTRHAISSIIIPSLAISAQLSSSLSLSPPTLPAVPSPRGAVDGGRKTVKPWKNPESHRGRMARGQGRVGTWQRYGQLSRFLPLATCQSDIELSIRRRGTFAPLSEVCVFRAFPLRSPWIESAVKKITSRNNFIRNARAQFIVEPVTIYRSFCNLRLARWIYSWWIIEITLSTFSILSIFRSWLRIIDRLYVAVILTMRCEY